MIITQFLRARDTVECIGGSPHSMDPSVTLLQLPLRGGSPAKSKSVANRVSLSLSMNSGT